MKCGIYYKNIVRMWAIALFIKITDLSYIVMGWHECGEQDKTGIMRQSGNQGDASGLICLYTQLCGQWWGWPYRRVSSFTKERLTSKLKEENQLGKRKELHEHRCYYASEVSQQRTRICSGSDFRTRLWRRFSLFCFSNGDAEFLPQLI